MGFVHAVVSSRASNNRWCFGFLISALMLAPAMAGGKADRDHISLFRSDAEQVSFDVRVENYRFVQSSALQGTEKLLIPGYSSVSGPGEPLVPSRKLLIAIPPDVTYSLRWTVLKAEPMGHHQLEPVAFPAAKRDDAGELYVSERYAIEENVYMRYKRKPTLEDKEIVHLRHQRVLPLWIHPVSYDPRTGETSIATRIHVEIFFAPQADGRGRSITMGESLPVQESPTWNRILSRILLNPNQAEKWRVKRRTPSGSDPRTLAPSRAMIAGPLVKLRVRETGMCKVQAASVIAAGFPANEPLAQLHLFKRGYDSSLLQESITDIPFIVHEDPQGVAGVFDGSDLLIFYGLRLREDVLQGDPIEKFADFNSYWLGTGNGLSMVQQPLRRGYVSADTASASFDVLDRYEEDLCFIEFTPPDDEQFYEGPIRVDVYGFNDQGTRYVAVPFTVHAMKPGSSLRIRAEILGAPDGSVDRLLNVTIENSKGNTSLNKALVPLTARIRYTSQTVPDTLIDEGENKVKFDRAPETGLNAYVNWVTVSYQALFRAKGNSLAFNTSTLSGDTSITVTGLTRKDLYLFDITDPYSVVQRIVADSLFVDVNGGYTFSFRETIAAKKGYILTSLDDITEIAPEDVFAGATNTLIGNSFENTVDVLVVCYPSYLDEMQVWVDYRRAQGYKVLMADVVDVYDEFNSGVPHPRAIKNFIRHFYEKGNASFVLLVGDASEDNRRVHPESAPNYIPTESFPEYVGYPFYDNEIVTSDKWYVMMDNDYLPEQSDFYPDLIIGRFPAGSEIELQTMLQKTFSYERPEASDFWRRRMIFVADDAWSGDLTICRNPSEVGFEYGQEESAQIIESSPAGQYDVIKFNLSEYTSQVHGETGPCVGLGETAYFTRVEVTPRFLAEMNAGATLVSIQAHMNRYQVCHEILFTSRYGTPIGGADGKDHRKLENYARPFILFGMGCHLSDYALYKELIRTIKNDNTGDCFSELLMLQINKGAVATYGSSGFEYLSPNRSFNNVIYETFFHTPPQDTMVGSDRAQVRWIFGEIMTISEIDRYDTGQIKRYHILGDPLLRIDAGPPRFEVTVNGSPVQNEDLVFGAAGSDTIYVEAIISDEVAIEKLALEIDGEDATDSMTVTPLLDGTLSASRKYEIKFKHKLLPSSYDIILRAYQSPDTTGNDYSMAAEFVLRVRADFTLKANGREVTDGDPVPPEADYLLELRFPVLIDPANIEVRIDDVAVQGLEFSHPSPQDTTTWLVSFHEKLADGRHTLQVLVNEGVTAVINLYVSTTFGLKHVINYPNPFTDDTYFVFTNEIEITDGAIDIFTTSGRKIAHVEVPPSAKPPGQNAVYWDGRDFTGDKIANGVYLYVLTVEQRGKKSTIRGKMARIE